MVKMAVLPPIPNASVKIAAMANPGFLRSMRAPKRKSCRNECICPHYRTWPCRKSDLACRVFALLNEEAALGLLSDIAGSRMNVIAHEHHQRIAGTQRMCAEQPVLAAKLLRHFRDLGLMLDHNRLRSLHDVSKIANVGVFAQIPGQRPV